jgi:hypothetical protein
MAGHSPSKVGVNALSPGHPRLTPLNEQDVHARDNRGHDEIINQEQN